MPRRRWSARLGRIAGIDIRVHASFLLLVVLVALGASTPGSPGLVPELGWLVALFASVVAHELAHSIVARRHSIPVLEIELLPIGGVSKMDHLPEDPQVEQRIALAGPLVSIAIGVGFGLVAVAAGVGLWPPALVGNGLLARMAWANLLLAGFNLVPALPLDGGRVLQAVLERRMDRESATRIAARWGRGFAGVLIAVGLFFNLWLLIIGIFIFLGSTSEERAATVHARLEGVRVREVMIQDPAVLPAAALAGEMIGSVLHSSQREFPVVEDGRLVGLVTADAMAGAAPRSAIGSLVDPNVKTIHPDELIDEAGLLTGASTIAVVVDQGRIIGLVRPADVLLLAQNRLRQRSR